MRGIHDATEDPDTGHTGGDPPAGLNAGRIDGATNVKVRSYLTDTPAETFQSLETMKQWMGVRKALEYAAIGRIEPDRSSGLAGTPDETGTLIRYFILTFIDRN